MKLSPAIKGLITGVLMMAIVLITYYSGMPPDAPFQKLIYIIYALGITWTIVAYRLSPAFTGKFWDTFLNGFRCFVVTILFVTISTLVFSMMHPEFKNESSQTYREQLITEKSKSPDEIESAVSTYKKRYHVMLVYGLIVGYLIIGTGITAAISAFIPKRK
ncbi:MAG: DUF4199 family protein [Bacteroidetes bacterium]|nr:DUF4199 family protein [Bacteroidota bacterium]